MRKELLVLIGFSAVVGAANAAGPGLGLGGVIGSAGSMNASMPALPASFGATHAASGSLSAMAIPSASGIAASGIVNTALSTTGSAGVSAFPDLLSISGDSAVNTNVAAYQALMVEPVNIAAQASHQASASVNGAAQQAQGSAQATTDATMQAGLAYSGKVQQVAHKATTQAQVGSSASSEFAAQGNGGGAAVQTRTAYKGQATVGHQANANVDASSEASVSGSY